VPDLTGKTVSAANRALTRARLAPEPGQRLELRTKNTRTPEFVARKAGHVSGQSIKPGTKVRAGTVVQVATVGPRVADLAMVPNGWTRIAFADGKVVLSGLQRWGDCINFDHATLAPPDANGARQITVWARDYGIRKHACERKPTAFVLRPGPAWTVNTIGVPRSADSIHPELTSRQAVAKVGLMLEPDRQTVLATYGHGACDDVAAADATMQGATGVVRVVIGADPKWNGSCTDQLLFGAVLVRLPAPLPAGGKLITAPCREPGEPGLPEDLPCYEG
jgi:hypothetical protein